MKPIGIWFLANFMLASPALAHQNTTVYLRLEPHSDALHVRISMSESDVGLTFGREGRVFREDVTTAQHQLVKYITDRLIVRRDGHLCTAKFDQLDFESRTGGFFAVTAMDYACMPSQNPFSIDYNLLFDIDPRHQAFVTVAHAAQTQELVLNSDHRVAELSGASSAWASCRRYVHLGIEHIVTGYDHLAFLLTLLLAVPWVSWRARGRAILTLVSAFTVAHSITLIASALGWARVPALAVEPAIAFSILFVALENYFRASVGHRFVIVFLFGLLHGFGFAGALSETGLPRDWLVLSLLSFNVGVEIGQLAFVICTLPIFWGLLSSGRATTRMLATVIGFAALAGMLYWAQVPVIKIAGFLTLGLVVAVISVRRAGADGLRRFGSMAVALFAAVWLLERIGGVAWFGGLLG